MAVSETSESGGRSGRLTRSREFDRVYRQGRSYATPHIVMYVFRRGLAEGGGKEATGDKVRLGVSVNKRIGGAVDRSKIKRLLRDAFLGTSKSVPADYDVVLVARPGLLNVSRGGLAGMRKAVDDVVEKMLRAEQ